VTAPPDDTPASDDAAAEQRHSSSGEAGENREETDRLTLIRMGQIFRPHGVKGELKINPETEDPERFETLETLYVGRDAATAEATAHAVENVRYQQTKRGVTVILKLAAVDTRDAAEAITKQFVFADENDLDLADDELFVHDLVGFDVVTEDGERIGMLSNVMKMPAQDLYVVHRPGQSEALIPAVEDFVVDLDLDEECLVVRPIDGLL
jgi:16S rRNA processing protein RimM